MPNLTDLIDLIADLGTIHPEIAKWAQAKRDLGWTDDGIRARLRTIVFASRPMLETFDGKPQEPREDDFVVPVILSARDIADLFVTAIESGSNYWAKVKAKNWTKTESTTKWWYDDEVYLGSDRFEIEVEDFEADEDDDARITYVKGRACIERGLAVMAEKYPHQFRHIVEDNHDAIVADVFFQCVVFGENVYG